MSTFLFLECGRAAINMVDCGHADYGGHSRFQVPTVERVKRLWTSVKEPILRGVDVVLKVDAPRRRRLKLPLIDSDEPGTPELDNEKIYDLIGEAG